VTGVEARTTVRFVAGGELVGHDGYRARFMCDDSLRSWLAISRWNLHYRHWRALAGNGRDLFTKVIGGRLWRRMS
jgi:hypothetical protein